MERRFWCAGWPDIPMAEKRLAEVHGVGAVEVDADGRGLTVHTYSTASAAEAALRLRELGWRPIF